MMIVVITQLVLIEPSWLATGPVGTGNIYPPVNIGQPIQKPWENHGLWLCQNSFGKSPFIMDFPNFPLKIVIFQSYVELPEGKW